MRRSFLLSAMVTLALGFAASSASAALVVLSATASGSYNDLANLASTNGNYGTGWWGSANPVGETRSYFVFDLSAISGTITSATLRVFQPSSGYQSPHPSETMALFDVSTALATLTANIPTVPIFNDLGTGTQYGSGVVLSSSNATVDIPFNAAGLAFLNGTHAPLAIGGATTSFVPGSPFNEALFNSTSAAMTRELVLEVDPVPEPASMLLLGAGAAALLVRRKRRS